MLMRLLVFVVFFLVASASVEHSDRGSESGGGGGLGEKHITDQPIGVVPDSESVFLPVSDLNIPAVDVSESDSSDTAPLAESEKVSRPKSLFESSSADTSDSSDDDSPFRLLLSPFDVTNLVIATQPEALDHALDDVSEDELDLSLQFSFVTMLSSPAQKRNLLYYLLRVKRFDVLAQCLQLFSQYFNVAETVFLIWRFILEKDLFNLKSVDVMVQHSFSLPAERQQEISRLVLTRQEHDQTWANLIYIFSYAGFQFGIEDKDTLDAILARLVRLADPSAFWMLFLYARKQQKQFYMEPLCQVLLEWVESHASMEMPPFLPAFHLSGFPYLLGMPGTFFEQAKQNTALHYTSDSASQTMLLHTLFDAVLSKHLKLVDAVEFIDTYVSRLAKIGLLEFVRFILIRCSSESLTSLALNYLLDVNFSGFPTTALDPLVPDIDLNNEAHYEALWSLYAQVSDRGCMRFFMKLLKRTYLHSCTSRIVIRFLQHYYGQNLGHLTAWLEYEVSSRVDYNREANLQAGNYDLIRMTVYYNALVDYSVLFDPLVPGTEPLTQAVLMSYTTLTMDNIDQVVSMIDGWTVHLDLYSPWLTFAEAVFTDYAHKLLDTVFLRFLHALMLNAKVRDRLAIVYLRRWTFELLRDRMGLEDLAEWSPWVAGLTCEQEPGFDISLSNVDSLKFPREQVQRIRKHSKSRAIHFDGDRPVLEMVRFDESEPVSTVQGLKREHYHATEDNQIDNTDEFFETAEEIAIKYPAESGALSLFLNELQSTGKRRREGFYYGIMMKCMRSTVLYRQRFEKMQGEMEASVGMGGEQEVIDASPDVSKVKEPFVPDLAEPRQYFMIFEKTCEKLLSLAHRKRSSNSQLDLSASEFEEMLEYAKQKKLKEYAEYLTIVIREEITVAD